MKTKQLFLLFIIVALIQAAVPMKMIYESEMTRRYGTEYKFETAPVDPIDPFKGKYIALSYTSDHVTSTDTTWAAGDEAYVYVEKDKAGFAQIKDVLKEETEKEGDYFVAEVRFYDNNGRLWLDFPFDRFYMEEGKAAEAEKAYADFNTLPEKPKPTYAVVAFKEGNAVLKDVIIDDIPIREYVLRARNRQK